MISRLVFLSILLFSIDQSTCTGDGYLQYVKDGCMIKGEALSCVKYKALRIAKKTIFGDNMYNNETIKATDMFSFVPLDEELIKNVSALEDTGSNQKRGFLSEWAELAKYMLRLVKEFFRVKGLRMELPDGARTIEEEIETDNNARGKRKRLALILPLLSLLAALKTKLLLIPILLAVLLIKKLLLAAAFLVPSLLHTLKACKHHHHSFFGSSDAADFSSDYGYSNSYASGGSYAKDWASNRAYNLARQRATQAPVYITAPGAVA